MWRAFGPFGPLLSARRHFDFSGMAPLKKKKDDPKKMKTKKKLKMKLKKRRNGLSCVSRTVIDPGVPDSDWWPVFLRRNSSSSPGSSSYEDEEKWFKHFFRVSKNTFGYICSLVREDLISRPPSGLINIEGRLLSVEKQVAIALRRLASGESQVSVGAAFGVGQSTVSQVTWRFIEALEERGRHHLKWPDGNRMQEIKAKFEALCGLPNCCGAIDATHITMTLPAVQTSDDWCDQVNNYSMFVQGVVDDELRFLDIVTGWPGGLTVSKLLKFSGLFRLCECGERLGGNARALAGGGDAREFIVGGAAYPLLPWLITPYENDGLTSSTSEFNQVHESVRENAVKAFSQLKGGWRILNKVMWRPDKQKLPSIILVCCLLHNIVLDAGDKLHPDVTLHDHHDSGYSEQCCLQADPLGSIMRDNLLKHLQRGIEINAPKQ